MFLIPIIKANAFAFIYLFLFLLLLLLLLCLMKVVHILESFLLSRQLLSSPYVQFCRQPSVRNMRHFLAPVILRLLGSRVVHDDADILAKREVDPSSEAASASLVDSSAKGLFDRLLLVLHGLLSSYPPCWLRLKPVSKSTNEPTREFFAFDREFLETLQV